MRQTAAKKSEALLAGVLPNTVWHTVRFLTIGIALFSASASAQTPVKSKAAKQERARSLASQPVRFEENHGQSDPQVKFFSVGAGHTLFLTNNAAVLALRKDAPVKNSRAPLTVKDAGVLRMKFSASNPHAKILGQQPEPGKVYYAAGGAKGSLAPNPTFGRVQYSGIYPGIDVAYYGTEQQLEFDFLVAPHADPGKIRMDFTGAEKIALDPSGELSLRVAGEEVRLRKPGIYQERDGVRTEVAGGYVLQGGDIHDVRFTLGTYDASLPLTIDPTFTFGTSTNDLLAGFEADSMGNTYVLGNTFGDGFPNETKQGNALPNPVCFLTKLDPTLSVVYTVVFGSMNNCDTLAISPSDVPFFTGYQLGFNRATTVVSVDDSNGSVQFNSFQVTNYNSDNGGGVTALAVSAGGNVFLLGPCRSLDVAEIPGDLPLQLNGFNTTPDGPNPQLGSGAACTDASSGPGLYSVQEPVLTVVDAQSGAFKYGTLLSPGENSANPFFKNYGLAVDNNEQAFIAGLSSDSSLNVPIPVTPDAYQSNCLSVCSYLMVVATQTAGGAVQTGPDSLKYASYLWQGAESPQFVRLGPNGSVYLASNIITGQDFPETQPVYPYDPFPGELENNSGIAVARFDLSPPSPANPLGSPNQFRYAYHFSPAASSNAGVGSRDALTGMRVFPSGAVAVEGNVFDPSGSEQDVVVVAFPSGQAMEPFVTGLLYSSGVPPTSQIATDPTGNLYRILNTSPLPPAAGQLDMTLDAFPSADPGANTPPAFQVPNDFSLLTSDPTGTQVFYGTIFAGDAEDGSDLPVNCDVPDGAFLPLGSTTITCSTTDSGGATTTKSFTITVQLNAVQVPAGNSIVQPADPEFGSPVTLTFQNVVAPGFASLQITGEAQALPPPIKPIIYPALIYQLYTNTTFTSVNVCVQNDVQANNLSAIRLEELINGVWTDITSPGYPQFLSPVVNQTPTMVVCGMTTSLGVFELVEPNTDPNGFIETIAGTVYFGYNGDNILAKTAQFNDPASGYADINGTLYIADALNSRVRMIQNGVITTVAGNGVAPEFGSSVTDDGGPATSAMLNQPYAIAKDRFGNLFIAERTGCRIRRVDLNGIISTVAGSTGPCIPGTPSSGDGGPATSAVLGDTRGLAFDPAGNLFFSETVYTPNGHRIRRIDAGADGMITGAPDEIISTVAGGNGSGFSGDGSPATAAQLNNPQGIVFDKFGNLFIADEDNQRVRRVAIGALGYIAGSPDEIISTVAGSGPIIPNSCSPIGDGGPATQASFCFLTGLAFDTAGNLLTGSETLRRIAAVNGQITGDPGEIIQRIAGSSDFDFNGDGSALSVNMVLSSVFTDPDGNVYLTDNELLRRYGRYITPNAAPVASNLAIAGVQGPGATLTGSYTYSDAEGDLEGASRYQWLRDGAPIGGGTSLSYSVSAADLGHAITFEVTPVAQTGTSPGYSVRSGPAPLNSAPVASNVTVSGTPTVGQKLTGQYIYGDNEGDLEGISTYRWLRDGAAIPGAASTTYTVAAPDSGHTLIFEVTPVAATGVSPGAPVQSGGILIQNSAPTATNVSIVGIANAGQVLTGEYAYSDLDGDLEGISTFRWLSDGVPIGGASSITYPIASGDVGHAITFEVTPVAITGVLQGAPVQSSPQTILNVPITQILSGPASISSQTAAVFTFQGFEPGLTFSCQLDSGTASLCSSGVSYTVTDGNHTFAVNAVNASGIAGPAVTYTWVVDTTPPPDPVIVGPQTPGDLTNVTFNFTDTENNVFFWCSVNGAPFTMCVSPLNINTPQLSTQQTFQVYAGDSVGNLGHTVTYNWIVYPSPPPAPTLVTYPLNPLGLTSFTNPFLGIVTNSTASAFAWTDALPDIASHTCTLDAQPITCSSAVNFNVSANFPHTFTVQATDIFGNPSVVTSFKWYVNTVPPTAPQFNSLPPSLYGPNQNAIPGNFKVSFFSADFVGIVKDLCSFDGGPLLDCTSPLNATGLFVVPTLANGPHTITVETIDESDLTSPQQSYSWFVDLLPPTVTPPPDTTLLDFDEPGIMAFLSKASATDNYPIAPVPLASFRDSFNTLADPPAACPQNPGNFGPSGQTPSAVNCIGFAFQDNVGNVGFAYARLKLLPGIATPVPIAGQPPTTVVPIDGRTNQPSNVTVTFNSVTTEGDTGVDFLTDGPAPLPANFKLGDPAQYYRILSTAFFSNPVTIDVCIMPNVLPAGSAVLNYNTQTQMWENHTVEPFPTGGPVCTTVNTLDTTFAFVTPLNNPPNVTNVSIAGVPGVTQVLTGRYTYNDSESDPEGTSQYQWFRNGAPINGATNITYTALLADLGQAIQFQVTPVARSGALVGSAVNSAPLTIVNSAPVASSVHFSGVPRVGQVLLAQYTYSDVDGDPEGVSTFRWLRDGSPIGGANAFGYTAQPADLGHFIAVEVTPAAASGATPGSPVQSAAVEIVAPPAFTSGTAVTFTVGTAGSFAITATGTPAPIYNETGARPAGVSLNSTTGLLSGTPAVGSGGVYPLALTASNGTSPDANQGFTLTVDEAPSITSPSNATFMVGVLQTFGVTTLGFPSPSVAESGALPNGLSYNATTHAISGTPAAGSAGKYTLRFTASNSLGFSPVQTFILTVNQVPAITSANSETVAIGVQSSFNVTATGFPTPTVSIAGTLPMGITFSGGTGAAALTGKPAAGTAGTYNLTFTASNGVTPNAVQNFTLTVTAQAAPTFTSANNATFTVGAAGSFGVTATGAPTPSLSQTTGGLPGGVSFNASTGVLSGTPAAGTGRVYNLTFKAQNGVTPNATQAFTLTVDQPPAITTANNVTFIVGTAKSFTIKTTGFPNPAISKIGNIAAGISLVDNGDGTATLSGTALSGNGGVYNVTLSANNGVSPAATQNFTLTVDEGAAITTAPSATYTVGTPKTFTVTATGYPVPTLSRSGALPSGVTFNDNGNATGTLAGTPAAGSGQIYNITFTAKSAGTPNSQQNFTLTVDEAPVITTAASSTFTVGTAKSFSVKTNGCPIPAIMESGAMPSGVTLIDNHNGTATLSGTPAAGTGGVYTLQITASNGIGSNAAQSFILTVDEAPAITSANAATFTVNTPGSFTITTKGYPQRNISESGALPRNVTFKDNGDGTATLNGTPVAGAAKTYALTITARNGVGTAATQTFTLTVH